MTTVYAERDGDRYLIAAKGHAADTESCNYITGTLYAFAGYAHNYATEMLSFRAEKTSGAMTVHCIGDDKLGAAFEAAVIGLMQLEEARPDAVHVDANM